MGGDKEGTGFTGQQKMVSGAGPFSGFLQFVFFGGGENCTIRSVLPIFVYPLLNQ